MGNSRSLGWKAHAKDMSSSCSAKSDKIRYSRRNKKANIDIMMLTLLTFKLKQSIRKPFLVVIFADAPTIVILRQSKTISLLSQTIFVDNIWSNLTCMKTVPPKNTIFLNVVLFEKNGKTALRN